ncbi:acetyltransferase [Caulobacter sp. RL271]|jgi:putative acetyltransferase|uniref:Acetyltransferase n=1 Tax=Caulobacter segnis TaxID=88688 RepID=A0ABY4ZPR8_9CAUL|nr:acetyltransferase [Caulobacter segnis]USQ94374.1 acetyltransferase [Caulobacter segnis]
MIKLRPSRPDDGQRVVQIWAAAVDATHDFLAPEDRAAIGREVEAFLPSAPLMLAVDDRDRPLGFMLINNGHMEALFIDPEHRGAGVGAILIDYALAVHPVLTTDVNAQNDQAVGFYEHMGFERTGWSATDGQGRPYPLIHLRFGV